MLHSSRLFGAVTRHVAPAAFLAMAATVAAEAAEINIYSSREAALVQPVFDAFTKQTGIKINTVFAPSGLDERIRSEGASSPADILLVVDIGRIQSAIDMGISQPIQSEELTKTIPAELRDADGHWFGLTQRARVVWTSRERAKIDAITYEELADPKWKGKICIRSGQHPYNVALIAAAIHHMGEEKAHTWLTGIKNNLAKKPSGGDRDVAKDIAAGVCDIGLANTYYMGLLRNEKDPTRKAWGDAVDVVMPTFSANGRTHVNVSAAIVAKNAPNKAEAIKLLEFMVSPEAQALYTNASYEYPVRPDAPINPTIQSFGPLKADSLSLTEVAKLRKKASELVDRVGLDN